MAPSVAKIATFVAALLATTAISVSSASADPPYTITTVRAHHAALDSRAIGTATPIEQVRGLAAEQRPLATRAASSSPRFDWTAAAIGALAAVAAALVLIGSVLGVRRRHEATAA